MKTYSYAYSPLYTPVAPVVEIEVSSDQPGTADIRLTALLDSGADATMLPIEVLTRIGARYVESLYMLGVAGTRMSVDLFHVTVRVGPHSVPLSVRWRSILEEKPSWVATCSIISL